MTLNLDWGDLMNLNELDISDINLDSLNIITFDNKCGEQITSIVNILDTIIDIRNLFNQFKYSVNQLLDNFKFGYDGYVEYVGKEYVSDRTVMLNTMIKSVMSAGRQVADYTDVMLKEVFSVDDIDCIRKASISSIYDSCGYYQLLYKLRNVNQHNHLLVTDIGMGRYAIDFERVLNFRHYDFTKGEKKLLNGLNDLYRSRFDRKMVLPITLPIMEFTLSVGMILKNGFNAIEVYVENMCDTLKLFVDNNPECIEHEDTRFNGKLIYIIDDDSHLHIVDEPSLQFKKIFNEYKNEVTKFVDYQSTSLEDIKSIHKTLLRIYADLETGKIEIDDAFYTDSCDEVVREYCIK